MEAKNYQVIAEYYCELFKRYSANTPIDRQEPSYRVSTSDLTAKFPELHLTDLVDLQPYIKREMKRQKLTWK